MNNSVLMQSCKYIIQMITATFSAMFYHAFLGPTLTKLTIFPKNLRCYELSQK